MTKKADISAEAAYTAPISYPDPYKEKHTGRKTWPITGQYRLKQIGVNRVELPPGVLERQLAGHDFVCDDYSIADMACWPWVNQHHDYLGDLSQFPNIFAWHERVSARPAVQRAMKVGTAGLPSPSKPR